jgi:hypothetical protein
MASKVKSDALMVRLSTMIERMEVINEDHNHPLWRDADKLSRRLVVLGELLFDGAGELADIRERMQDGTTQEPGPGTREDRG